ncbi:helix-turn-helix domain-containing protein [Acetivibrio ethanolgignens]|uniref:XRE family transcriptional regulator n=1 Tax=Acetivibrio ethanolgignens TaxID=290052 RepID=A0A0V8QDY9_9FIRM|nr:helix-turn-helix domain-containing protein [Acetivibrio ethanolgignens]KSV58622.1 XRE family transcriptional regulator [Acetivibrio ethanolgignens]
MERREVNAKATGEFLAALRKSKGYTQVEVAELLGVTNKTVSKWERGVSQS